MGANQFSQRLAGAAPQLVKSEDGELVEYTAFGEAMGQQRRPRFEVVTQSGELYGFAYSYLGEWVYHPRGFLTFSTAGSIVTVEGQGLERLHQLLRDERLASVHAFRPGFHQEPPDSAAKVTQIDVRGRFAPPESER